MQSRVVTALGWLVLAVWVAAGIVLVQHHLNGGFPLEFGSGKLPRPGLRQSVGLWLFGGGVAAAALARALFLVVPPAAVERIWGRGSDRAWMAGLSGLAFALALAVHVFVVRWLPLIEDESIYRYGADLLASGRLYAEGLPEDLRRSFANNFLVNADRRYPQYFIGWPLLLAPFRAVGLAGLANPVYFGLSVPAVFLLARRWLGASWARLAALLFATSPLAVLSGATGLSHTATMVLLLWTMVLAVRTGEPGDPVTPVGNAAMAVLFCLAFFIRPTTAVGLAGPFLGLWLWRRLQQRDVVGVVAFAVPAAVMAAAFLGVNQLQNGSPTRVSYQAYIQHAHDTNLEFSTVKVKPTVANFRFDVWRFVGMPLEGLYRLAYAAFGWPLWLVFGAFGVGRPGMRLVGASLVGMFAVHAFLDVTGVDVFGPVHVMEAMLPLLFLTVAGLSALSTADRPAWVGRASLCFVAAVLVVSAALYVPARLQNIDAMARAQVATYDLTRGMDDAVVFVPDRKFVRPCQEPRIRVRHNFRPENHPDLTDPVLWLNDLGRRDNREVMRRLFPDRTAWLLRWDKAVCTPRLVALEDR
jgi:hypothetical protein